MTQSKIVGVKDLKLGDVVRYAHCTDPRHYFMDMIVTEVGKNYHILARPYAMIFDHGVEFKQERIHFEHYSTMKFHLLSNSYFSSDDEDRCPHDPGTGEIYTCLDYECPIHGTRNQELDGLKPSTVV